MPGTVAGSSPLTRGKLRVLRAAARPKGLIPAHAGKTGAPSVASCGNTAHPRSRGENADQHAERPPAWGSSPLTRGKPGAALHRRVQRGLIPAHAGKTVSSSPAATCSGAHPRSRGENMAACMSSMVAPGSSPLTRGKHEEGRRGGPETGLIPAHAGKTRAVLIFSVAKGAHPRSRGENSQAEETMRPHTGSSPLTRGKRFQAKTPAGPFRLIPAHAGKTRSVCGSASE